MFNCLEDYVRDYLIERLEGGQPAHLMYYYDIVNYLIDPWIASKPWWWLINLYDKYYYDFIEVAKAYNVSMNRDLREIAVDVIKFQAWDLLSASPQLDEAFKIYTQSIKDKPYVFDDMAAKQVAYDLRWVV